MKRNGFTLPELLIALVITSVLIASVIGFFVAQKRVLKQEEASASMDATLRIGLARISSKLREAGYGMPDDNNLSAWVPWVTGFIANPNIRNGTASAPDSIDIASCQNDATATITSDISKSSTTLSLTDTSLVNTAQRRLIFIGNREPAHVVWVGTDITVDTNPVEVNYQGVTRQYFSNTPICRVDVITFAVDVTNNWLTVDKNDGSGAVNLLDNVIDLQIDTVTAGRQYRVNLTVQSPNPDPGSPLTRSASTLVTRRN